MKPLNKEIITAIIAGFIIGLIVTYGIWTANKAIKQKQKNISPLPTQTQLPSDSSIQGELNESDTIKLLLAQPEPHTLSNIETIIVSGTTQPESNIIIYSENNYQILIADTEGEFNTELELEPGINYLTITSITDSGQKAAIDRTVVYSTTEL